MKSGRVVFLAAALMVGASLGASAEDGENQGAASFAEETITVTADQKASMEKRKALVFPGVAGGMYQPAPRPPRKEGMKGPRPGKAPRKGGMAMHKRPGIPELALMLHNDYGVDTEELTGWLKGGLHYKDLRRLGIYAYTTGLPMREVVAMSRLYGKDESLRKALGLTESAIREGMISFQADRLWKRMDIPREDTIRFMHMGFGMHQINTAALLSRKSGKSTYDIMLMRRKDNKWIDVAKELGLSEEDMKEIQTKIRTDFPYA